MSEVFQIVLTSVLTAFGGILVITIGQLTIKLLIEPIHELRELIGEIDFALIYYSNVYTSPVTSFNDLDSEHGKRAIEASKTFREQAGKLRAKARQITWYRLPRLLNWVPPRSDIFEASNGLIGISNGVFTREEVQGYVVSANREGADKVRGLLRIAN
ncbi:MAG: hypothetical protein L0177_09635 [Chloroflexi bacterium]|nr:hypothetical protein [Chloroflexota bacterium]